MLSGGRVGVLLAIQLVSSACTGATPVPTPSPAPAAAAGCTTEQRIATNAPHEFDAEDLRAAALPRSELGTTYAAYVFDPGFGGFESNYERVRDKADRKDEERRALERYGRLVAYQSMFTATDRSAAVERIWTLVALFRDGAGASGYLANAIASSTATGAAEFALAGLGEEARGAGARAYVRRGRLLGQVGINARGPTDLRSELTALAQKLDDRLQRSVSGALRGYTGKPGTEIGAERVQSLALPRADLGPAYAGLDEDAFLNGFQDNLERAQTNITYDTREEEAEFEQCGRVTGYFEAFTSPDERTIVSTGAHLFTSEAGATGYLARFAERYKRLAGGTIGRQRVVAVSQLTVPRLGDTATAVALELPDRQRITVLVRRGRVIGETLVVNGDGARARTEAFELSRKLDDRIAGALR